jgi:hypothetical protein
MGIATAFASKKIAHRLYVYQQNLPERAKPRIERNKSSRVYKKE